MGFQDRDYYREDSYRSGWASWGLEAPVCRLIIIACTAVYVVQLLTVQSGVVTDLLDLDPRSVLGGGQIWRIVTMAFLHDPISVWHILFNMLFLWWFGQETEARLGSNEFARFYFAGILLASLTYLILAVIVGNPRPAIGASGAVMAVVMYYAYFNPRKQILVFFVFPIELRWIVVGYVIFNLQPVLLELGGGGHGGNVANSAHLGGLLLGYLYARYDWRFDRFSIPWKRYTWSNVQRRRNIRIYREDPPAPPPRVDNLQARMDEVLDKIKLHGQDSLTAEERDILMQASKHFRERNQR